MQFLLQTTEAQDTEQEFGVPVFTPVEFTMFFKDKLVLEQTALFTLVIHLLLQIGGIGLHTLKPELRTNFGSTEVCGQQKL